MSTVRGFLVLLVFAFVLATVSSQNPVGAAPARTIQITMMQGYLNGAPLPGYLDGASQNLKGAIDDRYITALGDYTLTMHLDLGTLSCPSMPGRIQWEPGLVAFVQSQTPRVGSLNLKYDKLLEPDQARVDSWVTAITPYEYTVQIFRWSGGATWTLNADGSTTVSYCGGSIEVFKKRAGKFVSREQCFGNYVNYDLTAR